MFAIWSDRVGLVLLLLVQALSSCCGTWSANAAPTCRTDTIVCLPPEDVLCLDLSLKAASRLWILLKGTMLDFCFHSTSSCCYCLFAILSHFTVIMRCVWLEKRLWLYFTGALADYTEAAMPPRLKSAANTRRLSDFSEWSFIFRGTVPK